jgi:uncharacterized phage-associated protein
MEQKTQTVYSVAKYIVSQCAPMSPMKLQKLVYYSQAWHLVWDDCPLIEEEFEGWAQGPVCRELWEHHRGMISLEKNFLSEIQSQPLSDIEKETIDIVLEAYGKLEGWQLSEMTHRERPWLKARTGIASGEIGNVVISKVSMKEYYESLL